jgi:outer membrane receptor protein involved in Fe transport
MNSLGMAHAARRALPAALMASTMLAGAGVSHAADVAAASASSGTTLGEVIVTASKREENLQKVAVSVQAFDTKAIKQLNIGSFNDYVKFVPSLQAQSGGPPNSSIIYMRGISDGGNGNHSGPQPSVGTYLDEQPVTTIGGTLDIHIYDVARIEVLPGPQGTLYGASSEAGTLKIITNQPSTSGLFGALDVQGNVVDHGSEGYVVEGFVNVPLSSNAAIRIVAFDEHDAGYIDNVPGTRYFPSANNTINNAQYVKNNFNGVDTFGGRIALKYDLNSNWTITPSVIAQDTRADGVFAYEPAVGDLQVQRFAPDSDHDRWVQAALTINGKIGRYDLTYSGGYFNRKVNSLTDYTDYSVAYDQTYGSGAYWTDKNGNPLANPQQEIVGTDRFEKGSNELRLASPSTDRFRFLVGLFQERQTHWIIQDYQIQGLAPDISVTGWPNTIWLTDQNRIDRDEAAFGEATFDITSHLSVTGGVRYYHYDNTLYGFYGYSANYSSHTGEAVCNQYPDNSFRNAPCVNLNARVADSGETYKANLTYKIDDSKLVYFTYSTGYRPGGVNRIASIPPYAADSLTNYELGWKTSWLDNSLRWNGAAYDEEFEKFQFAVLFPPNSLTGVQNAPSARILGVETNVDWRATDHLTFSGGGSYNHAVLTAPFCGVNESGQPLTNCAPDTIEAVKGQQLPFTPKFKGYVTGRYTWDMMGWTAHAQASVTFQTSAYPALKTADIDALGTMPGYASLDLALGAERDKTSFEVFVKNATDTRGQTNRFSPCDTCEAPSPNASIPPSQQVAPAIYVSVIQPLTVGIRVGQKF